MNLQEFLLAINGCATLVAADGTFLGVVSSNRYDFNSICNPHGQYGSFHSLNSVRNPHSWYGSPHGLNSAYNPHTISPPEIVYQGRVVLRVTKNTRLISDVPLIDPDLLFGVLLGVDSYAQPARSTTQFQRMTSLADYYVCQGTVLDCLGYYGDAIASYSQAFQTQLDNPNAWYVRGNELLNSQRYEEAITSYDRAIQLKPDISGAWHNRGLALLNLQQYEAAIASFDRTLAIKPDDYEAWNKRGNALLALQRYEEALACFDRVIQFKPDYYEVLLFRGFVLSKLLKRYEEAIASYDRMIQLKPDMADGWIMRGLTLRNGQRYAEAIASYDQAIQIKPDEATAWYGKAFCYGLQGIVDLAIKNLQWAINLEPTFREKAKTNSDFDAIREDERFKKLIDG